MFVSGNWLPKFSNQEVSAQTPRHPTAHETRECRPAEQHRRAPARSLVAPVPPRPAPPLGMLLQNASLYRPPRKDNRLGTARRAPNRLQVPNLLARFALRLRSPGAGRPLGRSRTSRAGMRGRRGGPKTLLGFRGAGLPAAPRPTAHRLPGPASPPRRAASSWTDSPRGAPHNVCPRRAHAAAPRPGSR